MNVSVFGLGYVGSVTAACLARDGHKVVGIDVNPTKVEQVGAGQSPIIEPGLDQLISQAVQQRALTASRDTRDAVVKSDISLICVGTPSNENGSLSIHFLENVCGEIGEALKEHEHYHVVVVRSTVLPGTVRKQLIPILEKTSGKEAGKDFGVCMNPEFLRESSAISDYYQASHVVIGQLTPRDGDLVERLYQAVDAPIVRTTIETAEMVKYANNAFHALKVAFGNEIGALCKSRGIDGQELMEIFCQDHKLNISPVYLRPGFAFGGSCLPKDLRALVYSAKQDDVRIPVLDAVLESNEQQISRGISLIESVGCTKVGVLGLSFKAGTDDVRESPIVPLVETLVGRGFDVQIYDANVKPERLIGANRVYLERSLPHIASLMRDSMEEVIAESEVIVIANGSKEFEQIPSALSQDKAIIDLVGVIKNGKPRERYVGICW